MVLRPRSEHRLPGLPPPIRLIASDTVDPDKSTRRTRQRRILGVEPSAMKTDNFAERRSAATAAKAKLLETFKVRTDHNDPAVIERAAARKAVADARAAREEARRLAKAAADAARAEAEAVAAETARREAAARAEAEAAREETERQERETAAAEEEARKKAARDERYAARKLRKQLGEDRRHEPRRAAHR